MNNSYMRAYCKVQEYNQNHMNLGCCCFDELDNTSVAQLRSTTAQTLSAVNQFVTFNTSNSFRNATVTGESITVNEPGRYLINYGFNASAGQNSALSLYINGVENASTRLTILDASGDLSSSIILNLNAGDVITMRVSVYTASVTLPADTLNAYITLTEAV